jgi:hypothetical protein
MMMMMMMIEKGTIMILRKKTILKKTRINTCIFILVVEYIIGIKQLTNNKVLIK